MRLKLMDILLLPQSFYQRLNENRITLYIGILLVGLKDILLNPGREMINLFIGKPQEILVYNISLAALFVVIIGLIDVVFFSLPLFDLFKAFKKEDMYTNSDLLIRIMKVYIIGNLIITPVDAFFTYLGAGFDFAQLPQIMALIVAILALFEPIWFTAAISRGINSVYRFEPIFKRLVFIIVLIWSFLLTYALGYIFDKLLFVLFK